MFTQTITPNPHIPCEGGMCLKYVRETFGLPGGYPNATAAWNGSKTQHRDRNFPAGMAVPVWYELEKNVLGHVVLRMPDGSCYSTSTYNKFPYHHPSLEHLEAFYAHYDMPLVYRGWTEDVQDIPVITFIPDVIDVEGTIDKIQESLMAKLDADDLKSIRAIVTEVAVAERKTIVNEVRFAASELGKALKDATYELKVWDQKTDNETGDRIIKDNRAEEAKSREAAAAVKK